MSINRGVDKADVVYIVEFCAAIKKNEIMRSPGRGGGGTHRIGNYYIKRSNRDLERQISLIFSLMKDLYFNLYTCVYM